MRFNLISMGIEKGENARKMPNFKDHLLISGFASAGTYLVMCRYYGRQPHLGELILCTGTGLLTGALPDVIEPAIHPNHRAFGHSILVGGGLAKLAMTNCARENAAWEEFLKILAAVGTVAYVCHLIADGLTPTGLPFLSG
jgi:membrane-bound metal-dependent hydrolase YbcI (DUF457 family)